MCVCFFIYHYFARGLCQIPHCVPGLSGCGCQLTRVHLQRVKFMLGFGWAYTVHGRMFVLGFGWAYTWKDGCVRFWVSYIHRVKSVSGFVGGIVHALYMR